MVLNFVVLAHWQYNKSITNAFLLYKFHAEKQSKQIKLCTKVPPSSKRSFFGGDFQFLFLLDIGLQLYSFQC